MFRVYWGDKHDRTRFIKLVSGLFIITFCRFGGFAVVCVVFDDLGVGMGWNWRLKVLLVGIRMEISLSGWLLVWR